MYCLSKRCWSATLFITILFAIVSCSDDSNTPNYYNGPLPVCKPDWVTNYKYHIVEPYKPVANSPNSLTAEVNGKPWMAEGGTHCSFYGYPLEPYPWCYAIFESDLSIGGTDGNKEYSIFIHLYNFNKPNERFEISLQPYTYTAYSITKIASCFELVELDTIKGVVNANFSASYRIKTYTSDNEIEVSIANGKVNNMKIEALFCRPDYKLRNSEYPFQGEWRLIEISDCYNQRIIYPPVDMEITMDITNEPNTDPNEYRYYDYDLKAYVVNEVSLTYKFLNDSTLITSSGGATQLGSSMPVMDFERYYFQTLAVDTFILKKNKNLLELRRHNLYLRFYR